MGFRLARLFGIGQHLLDSTLHDWKLFLEIDWPDRPIRRELCVGRGACKENVMTQSQWEITPLAWSIRVVAEPKRDGVPRS